MPERDVQAEIVGRRYDCDECGEEVARDPNAAGVLMSSPPQYVHVCPNGHRVNLSRSYPGYDVLITQHEYRTTPEGDR